MVSYSHAALGTSPASEPCVPTLWAPDRLLSLIQPLDQDKIFFICEASFLRNLYRPSFVASRLNRYIFAELIFRPLYAVVRDSMATLQWMHIKFQSVVQSSLQEIIAPYLVRHFARRDLLLLVCSIREQCTWLWLLQNDGAKVFTKKHTHTHFNEVREWAKMELLIACDKARQETGTKHQWMWTPVFVILWSLSRVALSHKLRMFQCHHKWPRTPRQCHCVTWQQQCRSSSFRIYFRTKLSIPTTSS